MKLETLNIVKRGDGNFEITVKLTEYSVGWCWLFPNETVHEKTFNGKETVWRDVETGERPGKYIEEKLDAIAWLHEYKAKNNK